MGGMDQMMQEWGRVWEQEAQLNMEKEQKNNEITFQADNKYM